MAVIDSFSFVSCVTTRGEYLDYQNGGSGDLGFIFTPVMFANRAGFGWFYLFTVYMNFQSIGIGVS